MVAITKRKGGGTRAEHILCQAPKCVFFCTWVKKNGSQSEPERWQVIVDTEMQVYWGGALVGQSFRRGDIKKPSQSYLKLKSRRAHTPQRKIWGRFQCALGRQRGRNHLPRWWGGSTRHFVCVGATADRSTKYTKQRRRIRIEQKNWRGNSLVWKNWENGPWNLGSDFPKKTNSQVNFYGVCSFAKFRKKARCSEIAHDKPFG